MPTLLHVGCGQKYKNQTTRSFNQLEWSEIRLDIDPAVSPDIIGTMTSMSAVDTSTVNAIFSSHNVEHLYPHEVPLAFGEFLRVLKDDGFVVITCPDLKSVCALVADDKLLDAAYTAPAGTITPLDILYGHRESLIQGHLYMAHRCGFTEKVLVGTLKASGFKTVVSVSRPAPYFDLWALASKSERTESEIKSLANEHFSPI